MSGGNSTSNTSPKRVLITGGAKRIGAALCRAFAQDGWQVIIHCRQSSKDAAQELARQLGGAEKAQVLCADLAEAQQRAQIIAEAQRCFGSLEALVNNASSYRRCSMEKLEDSQLRQDLEVNFLAPFALMRDFAAHAATGSTIINLLDSRIQWPDPDAPGYSIAKCALAQCTQMCALEWAPKGIRVNGIAPGYVLPPEGVPMAKMEHLLPNVPLGRRTTEEEIAAAALYLANAPTVTGQILYVDGGMALPNGRKGEKTP